MSDCNDHTLLPLGVDTPDPTPMSPAMEQCARTLYRQAWTAYREAGCPYGKTDRAMLVWYTLHGGGADPFMVTGKN